MTSARKIGAGGEMARFGSYGRFANDHWGICLSSGGPVVRANAPIDDHRHPIPAAALR